MNAAKQRRRDRRNLAHCPAWITMSGEERQAAKADHEKRLERDRLRRLGLKEVEIDGRKAYVNGSKKTYFWSGDLQQKVAEALACNNCCEVDLEKYEFTQVDGDIRADNITLPLTQPQLLEKIFPYLDGQKAEREFLAEIRSRLIKLVEPAPTKTENPGEDFGDFVDEIAHI